MIKGKVSDVYSWLHRPLAVRPIIVVLCGSMRFETMMHNIATKETMNGRIVLMPHVNLANVSDHSLPSHRTAHTVKRKLDRLHLAKIDLADEVIVVCPKVNGEPYIGSSTRAEIGYAVGNHKPIRYISERYFGLEGEDQ